MPNDFDEFAKPTFTVFNSVTKNSCKVNIDFIFDDVDDLLFEYEGQTYKLKSTLSKRQRTFAKNLTDFGTEYFPKIAEQFPDYGIDPKCPVTRKDIETAITTYISKAKHPLLYEMLVDHKEINPLNAAVESFVKFIAVTRSMELKKKEDKAKENDPNILTDYLCRLQLMFIAAKKNKETIAKVSSNITSIIDDYNHDLRPHFGFDKLQNVLSKYVQFMKDNEEIIKVIYSDPSDERKEQYQEFYTKFDIAIDSILVDCAEEQLKQKACKENITSLFANQTKKKFLYFVEQILKLHKDIVADFDATTQKIIENKNDQNIIHQSRYEFVQHFKNYMDQVEIWINQLYMIQGDLNEHEQTILDAQYMNIMYYFEHRKEKPDWIEAIIKDLRQHIVFLDVELTPIKITT